MTRERNEAVKRQEREHEKVRKENRSEEGFGRSMHEDTSRNVVSSEELLARMKIDPRKRPQQKQKTKKN